MEFGTIIRNRSVTDLMAASMGKPGHPGGHELFEALGSPDRRDLHGRPQSGVIVIQDNLNAMQGGYCRDER